MQIDDIPQDNSPSYHGHRKIVYGTQNGRYCAAESSGWAVEAFATAQAVADLDEAAATALAEVRAGRRSPVYYHMHRCRYDEYTLAQYAGVWRWQLRRHFRPDVFAALSAKRLAAYAAAFGLASPDELNRLP